LKPNSKIYQLYLVRMHQSILKSSKSLGWWNVNGIIFVLPTLKSGPGIQ